jgi:hypothetical protein
MMMLVARRRQSVRAAERRTADEKLEWPSIDGVPAKA